MYLDFHSLLGCGLLKLGSVGHGVTGGGEPPGMQMLSSVHF